MTDARPPKLFTFASGGWVLLAAILITVAGTIWNLAPLFDPKRERPRGDGRNPSSYGFDLGTTLVPREAIVSSGLVVDALPALADPESIPFRELAAGQTSGRGRYLVPSDKLVGVVLGGEARAYPLRVLVWHEVVNDVVGGVPIAVTYSPLSGGIAVFDRRVGGDTLTFGVSGLLYQSNLLIYDRKPGHVGESLWSQLQARAIAGPAAAAGSTLTVLPVALARWDEWSAAWPDTRVLAPLPDELDKYGRDVYGSYINSDELRFPVDPLPPPGARALKTQLFVDLATNPPALVPLVMRPDERKLEVVGPSGPQPALGMYAYWFAWYATHFAAPPAPG
jgi:hypothetical protein